MHMRARQDRAPIERPLSQIESPARSPGPAAGFALALQRGAGNRAAVMWIASRQRLATSGHGSPTPTRTILQRFTEEDVKTAAWHVWERKGKPPNQSPEDQAADYAQARRQLEVKDLFSAALEAQDPVAKIKEALQGASATDKRAIWFDAPLMDRARQKVGDNEFMALVALLGVAHKGTVEHKAAADADKLIRDKLGQEAATAIRANKTVEGQVAILDDTTWATVYATEFPHDTQAQQLETNAFVATKHPGRPIILHKDRGNPGTIIHEGIHKYSHDAVGAKSWNLDEGMTEFFTRELTTPLGIARANYDEQFKLVEQLVAKVGRPLVVGAYFDGKMSELQFTFIKMIGGGTFDRTFASFWTDFLTNLNNDRFAAAIGAVKNL